MNQVVPRAELDAAVDAMAAKLLQRLPTIMRYTKQQLNFWRDLSWSMTVQHARDWLSVHSNSPEVAEGLAAFHEKPPGGCARPAPGAGRGGGHGRLDLRRLRQPRAGRLRLLRPLRRGQPSAEC